MPKESTYSSSRERAPEILLCSKHAVMYQILGCYHADLFAGIVSLTPGEMPVPCEPSHPVSLLEVSRWFGGQHGQPPSGIASRRPALSECWDARKLDGTTVHVWSSAPPQICVSVDEPERTDLCNVIRETWRTTDSCASNATFTGTRQGG